MGIDALDLSFRLEKRLGITISQPEAIATFFDTVGTIHRYLVAKLNGECRSVPKIGTAVHGSGQGGQSDCRSLATHLVAGLE